MMAESRNLLALLNGLARQDYYGEKEIDDTFLRENIYPDLAEEDFKKMLQKYRALLRNMTALDMNLNQLEAFLTSQVRKREGGLSEEAAKVLTKFWKSHKTKLHDSLISSSVFNSRIKDLSWRIDVKTKVNSQDQPHSASAVVEMDVVSSNDQVKSEQIQFEVDSKGMKTVLESIQAIEGKLSQYTSD